MTELIDQLAAEHKKFKEEFTEKAKNAMRSAFSVFFTENPTVTKIVWTQYTPYFNDGDPCVFGVNDMYFSLNTDPERDPDDDNDEDNMHGNWFYDNGGKLVDPVAPQRATFVAFTKSVSTLPDEIFLDAFGDHVRVIATITGFDVQEYEHD